MSAYDLVQRYRSETGRLPLEGNEMRELRYLADRLNVEMPDEDDVLAVCQQLRTWTQPAQGQAKLFE